MFTVWMITAINRIAEEVVSARVVQWLERCSYEAVIESSSLSLRTISIGCAPVAQW